MHFRTILATLGAAAVLSACGGGSSPVPSAGSPGVASPSDMAVAQTADSSIRSTTERAIGVANSIGSPVKAMTDFEREVSQSAAAPATSDAVRRAHVAALTPGTCTNGVLFNAPDLKGTPNTTEQQYFYDSGCTQLARDIVRVYNNPNGTGNETVYRTMKQYYAGSTTMVAIRADTVYLTQGTYDTYGFPLPAAGYVRTSSGNLGLPATKYIYSNVEQVLEPQTTNVAGGPTNDFCMDSAGYNATGIAALNETFGWSGGIFSGGTRTQNNDGSVTWQGTHAGSSQVGAIGGLYISYGTPSTTCPIASPPLFSLAGGTSRGNYTIPVAATFQGGLLTGLTVTGATLADGDTLSLTSSGAPTSPSFVTGTISNKHGKAVATIALNTFGDGSLTVNGGTTYVIVDWHVKN